MNVRSSLAFLLVLLLLRLLRFLCRLFVFDLLRSQRIVRPAVLDSTFDCGRDELVTCISPLRRVVDDLQKRTAPHYAWSSKDQTLNLFGKKPAESFGHVAVDH